MLDLYCNTDRFWHEISRANELCSQRSGSKVRIIYFLGLPDEETFTMETYVANGVDLERMIEQHEARMDILCNLVGFEGYGHSAIDETTLVWLRMSLEMGAVNKSRCHFNLASSLTEFEKIT